MPRVRSARASRRARALSSGRRRCTASPTPWTSADLRIAEGLRITLLEVILQLADLAARERKGAQERQELMIAELNHRVRNILSLVRGLVTQSKDTAGSIEEFSSVLGGRIQALARAHDQITSLNWAPVALQGAGGIRGRRLSRRARGPHQDGGPGRRARSQGVRDAGAGRPRDDDQLGQIWRARRFRPARSRSSGSSIRVRAS